MTVEKYPTNKAKTKFKWWFVVDVPATEYDRMGKPKRKQVRKRGFNTKKEAEIAERQFLNSLDNGTIELNTTVLLKDTIKEFLNFAKNEGKYANGTIKNYEGYYNNHLQEIASVPIRKITPNLLQTWRRNLFKKGTSDHVYNGCIKLLKRACSYCIDLKLITTNPFNGLKPINIPPKLRNRFTVEELKEIISTCIKQIPEFYCIFCLATLTGMREGEYSAIRPCDIKKKERNYTIHVFKQITGNEFKNGTKTEKSMRVVDISDRVYDIIQWHIKKYNIGYSDFLFKADKGGMVYARWVERKFEKLLKICGYPKDFCRVHDLRGQYVDLMHFCNVPLVYISRQVGHSNLKTTAQVYTQILNELPVEANHKLDEIMFGDIKNF